MKRNRQWHIKVLGLMVCCNILVGVCCSPSEASSADFNIKDHPSIATLLPRALDFSLNYQRIDDGTDIFNVRDDAISSVSARYQAGGLGDMDGLMAGIGYGITDTLMIRGNFGVTKYDYGYSELKVMEMGAAIRKSIIFDHAWLPDLAVDMGIKYNLADDQTLDNDDEINAFLTRFNTRGITVRITDTHVWFDKVSNNAVVSLGNTIYGRPMPNISTENSDLTPYIRLTLGKEIKEMVLPNVYLEYGKTDISSKADSTLVAYVPVAYKDDLPPLPLELDRDETYMKYGANCFLKLPKGFSLFAEIAYLKLSRDAGLDYLDDNTIVTAEVNYDLTDRLTLSIGGTYYRWQLNGIVPFLYNQYTQTTFDHSYGNMFLGVSYLFSLN